MKNRKKVLLIVVLLLLVGLTSGYVASTYAKYTSQVAGNNGTVTVAKWAFTSDNRTQSLTINLSENYDASTLIAGRIAPGTSGSFNIALSNASTETGVNWTIQLNSVTNKPTNLKFYKDSQHTTELTPGTSTITGQLAAKDSTGLVVPIYWAWEYETSEIATNDPLDTSDGEAGEALTIGVDITGVQTQPGSSAITSHINQ